VGAGVGEEVGEGVGAGMDIGEEVGAVVRVVVGRSWENEWGWCGSRRWGGRRGSGRSHSDVIQTS
jgi:hypothetical protein